MGDRNAGGRPETRNRMGGSDAKYRKRGKKGFVVVVVVYLLSVCLFDFLGCWSRDLFLCVHSCILVFLYSCFSWYLGEASASIGGDSRGYTSTVSAVSPVIVSLGVPQGYPPCPKRRLI